MNNMTTAQAKSILSNTFNNIIINSCLDFGDSFIFGCTNGQFGEFYRVYKLDGKVSGAIPYEMLMANDRYRKLMNQTIVY